MTYEIDVAGLKRELPLCKVSDDLYIGAFVLFGDVELTVHCATELLKLAPEYDYLIAPEAKSIPLLYEMARQSGADKYFLARKGPKAYMSGVFEVSVKSITTLAVQKLVIDTADAELIKGKRMLILDDVISTGESLHAVEKLVEAAGGTVVGRMAVLAEGDAAKRDDIIVLAPLPLFNADGTPKASVLHVPEKVERKQLLKQNVISCSSVLIRRETALSHPFPDDPGCHEDYAVWLSVLSEGGYARGLDEPLLVYRLGNGKSSNKFKAAAMNWRTYKTAGLSFPCRLQYMFSYAFRSMAKYAAILLKGNKDRS